MNPPVARCPLTLPSPPVGERVADLSRRNRTEAEGRGRGFRGPMREILFRGILSPSDTCRAGPEGLLDQMHLLSPTLQFAEERGLVAAKAAGLICGREASWSDKSQQTRTVQMRHRIERHQRKPST